MTTEYQDNVIHGTETWYDESGRKVRVRNYITGEMVSERIVQPGEK